MIPEDLFGFRWVLDARLSPDGARVAFVVCEIDRELNDYVSSIWVGPSDGSTGARPYTWRSPGVAQRDLDPRWSPDGSQIAFTSTREKEREQLYVMDAAGGEARRLTDLPEEVVEPAWSHDGSRIAFASRVPDSVYDEEDERKRGPRRFTRLQFKLDNVGWTGDRRQHIFTVASDGSGEPIQLTDGDFEDESPVWSPDGTLIAFVSNRDDDWDLSTVRDVYVIESEGGEPKPLTGAEGTAEMPAWSPDGSAIAFHLTPGELDEPRHARIAVVDVTSHDVKTLTDSLDRNCNPYPPLRAPEWTSDDTIVFGLEDHGNTHLYSVTTAGRATALVTGELNVAGWDCAGPALVYLATTSTELPQLFAKHGDRVTRLTNVQRPLPDGRSFLGAERFTAISKDGSEVDAWIVRPEGFVEGKRYPVLLNIHGGPFAQYGNRFFDEFQVQAGAGYVVLYSNPRGSSGSTEEWGRAIRGPGDEGPGMGSVDYEDVMAVVDTALERFDFCDPERLGVLGGSYGGYLTSWIVAHTDRFKAACSERSVNDWHSMFGSSDSGWTFKGYVGSFLFEDQDAWRAISPASYATEIRTPLLIMHAENDLRCNVEQAEQLFTTLRLLKREVELVRWPAEGHEMSRSGSPAHRVGRFEVLLEWFGRYLSE
jgi:dipeptidyl aminopeptidase/acylaminoacyl peptidase